MRFNFSAIALLTLLGPSVLTAASGLTAADVTVGKNLQMYASVKVAGGAPQEGLKLTLTSDDPSRLLISRAPDQAGSATIDLMVQPRFPEGPEFWLQALADHGTVTYTVTAPGMAGAKGTVTLAPSAILITGPFKAPTFPTTPRAVPARIAIYSAALDSSAKVLGEQQVAGGSRIEVTIASSNPKAGKLRASALTLSGGSSSAVTWFEPSAEGKTALTPVQPRGFVTPAEYAAVTASVEKPGIAVVGETFLGKDLELPDTLCLGEPAPPGGLKVTLTSSDGSKLLISAKETELGSASVTIEIPEGKSTAPYYLQGLGDSGDVTYAAEAPGFRSRTGKVRLTPSGFIVAYERYGPPDEAAVLRPGGADEERRFFVSAASAKDKPIHVVVWSVHLDPQSRLAADITVQALRPGVTAIVNLKSSNPEVGTVESPLTITPGLNHAASRFTPVGKGVTVITLATPSGFSTPRNATSVPATVSD